jgi:archaellum biogenesis ATPase FlaH
LREVADLGTVIGQTVKLSRKGHDLVGLCPFHAESTPSFHVRSGKGWYCHGCGANGDVIGFVQRAHQVEFLEAVRLLSSQFRIDVEGLGRQGDGSGHAVADASTTRRSRGSTTSSPSSAPETASTTRTRMMRVGTPAPASSPTPARGDDVADKGGPMAWRDGLAEACATSLWDDNADAAAVRSYLFDVRRITEEAARHWGLGALVVRASDGRALDRYLTVPVRDARGNAVNVRFRTVPGDCLRCDGKGCKRCKEGKVKKAYLRCPDRPTTLYGVETLRADKARPVYVTEGELDVVSLWQLGVRDNVVSGTAGAGTWQDDWLDALEPYRNIVLCYDADDAGERGAKNVADRLGRYRCSRAILPRKDAGECVADQVPVSEVMAALDNARNMVGVQLRSVDHYANDIEALIQTPASLVGLPSGSQRLDKCIAGIRPGLIIVTGDTGSGKTTFTSWLALEQARRGVPVLLTSFEQSPIGTIQKLLRAQVGGDFAKVSADERARAMHELGQMPITLVDHYGRMKREEISEAIRYAVRRLDTRVIVVDHLGFVSDPDAQDERRDIEETVRSLALLGVQENVAIVLICHPNRMAAQQQRRITMKDLKGASAIEQDAHLVLVVERQPIERRAHPSTAIHVDKCRSEFGLPGSSCSLAFDPAACIYADEWVLTPQGRKGGTGASIVVPDPPSSSEPVTRRSQRQRGGATSSRDASPSQYASDTDGWGGIPTDESGVPV